MDVVILFVLLFGMIAIGVPVAIALAGSSAIFIVFIGTVPEMVVAHRMVNGVDSFPLLAVPFFILAGNLMNTAGITERIFNFAKALIGWMRGGLGHVNIGASVIFAGMSGAAVADAGGLGAIEIKAMRDAEYELGFAVGITAASSTIGPIIPPSLPMVIYGVVAGASIGQLFAAGFVPGLIMALSLMIMVAIYARVRGYPRDQAFHLCVLCARSRRRSCRYDSGDHRRRHPVGRVHPDRGRHRRLRLGAVPGPSRLSYADLKRFLRVSFDTIETTAVVLFVVAAASIFAWILTSNRVPEHFAALILSVSDTPWVILLLINLILLIVGCFMETVAAITILVPVLLPIAVTIGIDPVHFGVIIVLNLMIGLLTPPVGMVLYVLARVSKLPFETCMMATLPFLVPLVLVLLLVTFVPGITMWLPTLLYR